MDGNNISEKAVFIGVRHGDFDRSSGDLTLKGEEQMREIVMQVRKINIAGLPVVVVCSTAPRAEQCGKIIAKELGISEENIILKECLWYMNQGEIKKFLEEKLCEDAIFLVVTHIDVVPFVAGHVARMFGSRKRIIEDSSCGKGWMITKEGVSSFPQ